MRCARAAALGLALFLLPAGAAAQTGTKKEGEAALAALKKAYQREASLLGAEKKALADTLAQAREASKKRRAALRQEIDGLMGQLTTLRVSGGALEDQVKEDELKLDASSDRAELMGNVVEQALDTLEKHGVSIAALTRTRIGRTGEKTLETSAKSGVTGAGRASSETTKPNGKEATPVDPTRVIRGIFSRGVKLVRRQGSIRWEEGTFYGPTGAEIKGKIARLGQVAAIGRGAGVLGMLRPAGGGKLQVKAGAADPSLIGYLAGKPVPALGVFLLDPASGRRASAVRKGWLQTIKAGGVIVWPILGLALVALLIVLERLFTLQRVHHRVSWLMARVGDLVRDGLWRKAVEECDRHAGAVSRVLKATLRNRQLEKSLLEDSINEAILAELPTLQRFIPALGVIAAVAPLLGLLGTVTGMISTFEVITEHGTGDPKLLSGGISEALITTELGLMLAIPVLLVHSLLRRRVEHILDDMEQGALKVCNTMHRMHCPRLKRGDCDCGEDSPCPRPHHEALLEKQTTDDGAESLSPAPQEGG